MATTRRQPAPPSIAREDVYYAYARIRQMMDVCDISLPRAIAKGDEMRVKMLHTRYDALYQAATLLGDLLFPPVKSEGEGLAS